MKKKVFALALAAVSLVGFNSVAQNPSGNTCSNTETCAKGKPECSPDNKCERPGRACPFNGLNLSDAQKSKIKDLNDKCRNERRERKQQANANRKDEKRRYLQEVKAILGPEMYVEYLENIVISKDSGRHPGKHLKGMRGDHSKKMAKPTAGPRR